MRESQPGTSLFPLCGIGHPCARALPWHSHILPIPLPIDRGLVHRASLARAQGERRTPRAPRSLERKAQKLRSQGPQTHHNLQPTTRTVHKYEHPLVLLACMAACQRATKAHKMKAPIRNLLFASPPFFTTPQTGTTQATLPSAHRHKAHRQRE